MQEVIFETLTNTLLEKLLSLVDDRSLRIRSFPEASSGSYASKILRVVNTEHLAIIDDLLDGEQKRVAEAVGRHLSLAAVRTIKAFKERTQS